MQSKRGVIKLTFTLTKDQIAILKKIDFSEIEEPIVYDDNQATVTVPDSKVGLFLMIISEEIDVYGLTDDQDDVLPYGRKLYAIYDSVYYQRISKREKR